MRRRVQDPSEPRECASPVRALTRARSDADYGALYENVAAPRTPSVQDELERAESLAARELLFTLRFRVVSHRREIDAALVRLADGAYGSCLECGRPIEPKRLRALPWAERCHSCQTAKEQEGDGHLSWEPR